MDPSAVGRIAEEVIMICETNGGRPTLKADLRSSRGTAKLPPLQRYAILHGGAPVCEAPLCAGTLVKLLLYEWIVVLLPLCKIHNDGDNISETNVLQLFSRQRRSAPRFALYEDPATCIHLQRETQLLPDAKF
jgi:hypothetical protein